MHRNTDRVVSMRQERRLGLYDRLSKRLYQIVSQYPVDPVEFIDAVAAIGYGLLLIFPADTFGTGKGFTFIKQVMSETGAGCIFLAVGLFFMGSILLEHRRGRIVASLATAFCFMLWSVMLGFANLWSMGWFIYGLIAWLGYWAFLRNCSRLPI